MAEQEPAEQSPCPGPTGRHPLGHPQPMCPPASPPELRCQDSPPRTASAALFPQVPLTQTAPGGDTCSLQRGKGIKKCTENIPENAGPFLRGAAAAEDSPSFSALAPRVKGGPGPLTQEPKREPPAGSEGAPAPAPGAGGLSLAGTCMPPGHPHPPQRFCWSLTLWGPRAPLCPHPGEARLGGLLRPHTQAVASSEEGSGSGSPAAAWQRGPRPHSQSRPQAGVAESRALSAAPDIPLQCHASSPRPCPARSSALRWPCGRSDGWDQ